jgi:hypothetical protein
VLPFRAICVVCLLAALQYGCGGTSEPSPLGDAGMPDVREAEPPSAGASGGGGLSGITGGGAGGGAGTADVPPPISDPDPARALFAPDRLLDVEIEIDPADWDELRTQGRSLLDIFGGDDCQAAPYVRPFTHFRASVTVDGVRVDDAGVRKKGFFGSLSADKPSLKIDFAEFVAGRTLDGVRRLTLNNAKQDASHMNQCLGYALFRDAGVPAPRCNFARVAVNGDDLGIYVNVEPIGKPFLRQHFDDDGGNLYEGTLSDFRAGWTGTFERKTNEQSDPSRADIDAVVAALSAGGDPIAALEPRVDLDRFVSLWAMESLAGHVDGYANNQNNFYLYSDPQDGRFTFIPWGADQLFDNGEEPGRGNAPLIMTEGALAGALYADAGGRARYVARLRELLDGTWQTESRLAEVERMRRMLAPHLPARDLAAFEAGVGRLERFLRERPAAVRARLAALPAEPVSPRDSICFQHIGTLRGSFATAWNSLDNPAVDARTFRATLTPQLTGFSYMPRAGGLATAVAGLDPDADNPAFEAAIVTVIQQQDGSTVLVVLSTARERLRPGTLTLDHQTTRGIVARERPGQATTLVGILADGEVVLEQASSADGAPIAGAFSGTVYDLGALLGR